MCKLPAEQQHIDISVSQIKGSLSIVVRNPYEGNIIKSSSGQILTSKSDIKNHGIGLISVQRTVDKYNGELLIDYENNVFKVSVLIYPPENLHGEC